MEEVVCNLCGAEDEEVLSRRDRYGFSVRTVICRRCGLIYINPRMTAPEYAKFYDNEYRDLLGKYWRTGVPLNLDATFEAGCRKGDLLSDIASPFIKPGFTVEVGSSCGGILASFKKRYPGIAVFGIEPSSEEARFAESRGIKTRIGLMEDLSDELKLPCAQNIIIARTLNHLLDPKGFFLWAHGVLQSGGHIIIMALNFTQLCRERGEIHTQIDHPYMFSQNTLINFVKSACFLPELIKTKGLYVYVVAKKSEGEPFSNLFTDQADYRGAIKSLNRFALKTFYFKKRLRKYLNV